MGAKKGGRVKVNADYVNKFDMEGGAIKCKNKIIGKK